MKQSKNKIYLSIFLSVLVPLVFYLIINFIIHRFTNMAVYDTLSDMVGVICCFMILFYSYEFLSGKNRKYLIIGSIFFIVSRFIEIVLQELIILGIYGFEIIWLVALYFSYFGIIYLFLGYRRLNLNGN